MKIKKGDQVIIVSGKDKGKKGKVIKALPREGKVIVDGINMKKKHQKPRRSNQKGQIIEYTAPVHVSNTMIVDPKTGEQTRMGIKIENGRRIRITKKSGTAI